MLVLAERALLILEGICLQLKWITGRRTGRVSFTSEVGMGSRAHDFEFPSFMTLDTSVTVISLND